MNKFFVSLLSLVCFAAVVGGCAPVASPPVAVSPTATPSPSATVTRPPTQTTPSTDLPDVLARLHWLVHASFRLDGPPTIYFDPALSFTVEPPPADIILITHSHSDHYFPPALKRISNAKTVIITTPLIVTLAQADGVLGQVRGLRAGERTTVGQVEIEAVPAYNIGKSFHPKEAETLGFIVTLYGRRIYFAGDTDLIPEMANLRADVALLPVGGTYTMDAKEAAQAIALFKPKAVVPMHALNTDLEQFRSSCNCGVIIMKEEH